MTPTISEDELKATLAVLRRMKQIARAASRLPGYDKDYGLGEDWRDFSIADAMETVDDLRKAMEAKRNG